MLILIQAVQQMSFGINNKLDYVWSDKAIRYMLEVTSYFQLDNVIREGSGIVNRILLYGLSVLIVATLGIFLLLLSKWR